MPAQEIAAFCRRHGVARLALFGSILRDDFGPESDVDVFVEFHPYVRHSPLDLGGMRVELRQLLGRQAGLETLEDLCDQVVQEAKTLCAA
ncbi:MAG: nucleotidyltransferase [Leptolyngbya sp. PLA3]|nr:MAG: nucleotidyltransferase [Cyanobacteria bacterium CYA]MCE7968014.1 nucleotidyltransferase [Leptolyngbya sp. PL-A3]